MLFIKAMRWLALCVLALGALRARDAKRASGKNCQLERRLRPARAAQALDSAQENALHYGGCTSWGIYMGVDPVDFKEGNIHAFNRYTYANNNPYKFVDPDGHQAVENLLGKEAPIVVIGNAFGALAAYAVGVTSGNESLKNAALQGMAESRQANIEAVGMLATMGRSNTRSVGELKLLHPKETIGSRPDLAKLSDSELMRSVTNPSNGDKIKISTESGKVVDGNSRVQELQRRAGDPKSSITPNTQVPVELHTPDRSMFSH